MEQTIEEVSNSGYHILHCITWLLQDICLEWWRGERKTTISLVMEGQASCLLSLINVDSQSMDPYLPAVLSWSSLSVSAPWSFKHAPQLIKGDGKPFNPVPTTQGILLQHFQLTVVPRVVTLVLRTLLFRLCTQYLFSDTLEQIWRIWRSRC